MVTDIAMATEISMELEQIKITNEGVFPSLQNVGRHTSPHIEMGEHKKRIEKYFSS